MSDRLLPPNATAADLAMEQSTARLADLPSNLVRWMQSPQNIPANALPWLAWAFSVDTWDETWTDEQKRATIAASYMIHRHKGTVGAVTSALAALGIGLQLVEWFNDTPPAAPYTFRLTLNAAQTDIPQAQLLKAQDIVMATKNLRSHLTGISVNVESDGSIYWGGALAIGNDITIQSGN